MGYISEIVNDVSKVLKVFNERRNDRVRFNIFKNYQPWCGMKNNIIDVELSSEILENIGICVFTISLSINSNVYNTSIFVQIEDDERKIQALLAISNSIYERISNYTFEKKVIYDVDMG